jgi:cobalt-zinc-cadmium efflux system outer membrane protein
MATFSRCDEAVHLGGYEVFREVKMRRPIQQVQLAILAAFLLGGGISAQTPLTWRQVREKFQAANPTLLAGQIGIEESKASEITAYLRPNPALTAAIDQLDPFTTNPYRPLGVALPLVSFSYLHERQHKRELRLESAQKATGIVVSQQTDLERTLLFSLRSAFVQVLQAKQVLALAKDNLDYFDRELTISRSRLKAGDIAQVDLDRLELQRVQYESDYETATVNLRSAKIVLLTLLNDRSPLEQFDVAGSFESGTSLDALDAFHTIALESRPDLKASVQAIEKARTDYKLAVANGSTDPTFGVDIAHNPPITAYFGVSVNIPLRIFDRNQGEKERTRLDVTHAERMHDAAVAQVFSDVDSAYVALVSSGNLLRAYKEKYLATSTRVRETVSYSYMHGAAALVDFLDAQRDYRAVQVAYLSLTGAYLTAVGQLNLAVGREAIDY